MGRETCQLAVRAGKEEGLGAGGPLLRRGRLSKLEVSQPRAGHCKAGVEAGPGAHGFRAFSSYAPVFLSERQGHPPFLLMQWNICSIQLALF